MVSVERLAFDKSLQEVIDSLEAMYREMDREYGRAASHYGFECNGCSDNCCLTRFYHHTFLEYICLRKGFAGLEKSRQKKIRDRAEKYVEALEENESRGGGSPLRMMCPVNESGLCVLYTVRPMICRLHGLPHELAPPGRPKMIFGQGCREFASRCGHLPYVSFDRTRFYMQMSELERKLKEILGISGKSKKTVAHMIVCDEVEGL
ncbi:MAG: hypothetical protein ACOC7W_05615 [Desulfosalsimonas sp.]